MPTILRCHLATYPTSLLTELSSDCPLSAPSALVPAGLVNDGAIGPCLEIKRPRREAVPSLLSSPQIKQHGPKTTAEALIFMREFWTFVVRISVTTKQSIRFFVVVQRPSKQEPAAHCGFLLYAFHFITH